MKKFRLFASLLLGASLLLTGCSGSQNAQEKDKDNVVEIYTTVYPLQYFAERIGGKDVSVETIYPPGADEHTFEPSQKDMMELADSDLFIYVGLGLEGFVEKAKETLKNEDVKLISAGSELQLGNRVKDQEEQEHEEHEEDGHQHGDVDPHVWLDPQYAKAMAIEINTRLGEVLPSKKKQFDENYQQLAGELDSLDKKFKNTLSDTKHDEFLVSHAAYGYWEDRYGIEQTSISGLSTTNEPSQKKLGTLVTHAKKEGIKYVLMEQNFESRIAETVRKELNAKKLILHNLSVLTEEDIEKGETYFTLMEKNLKTLDKALNE
ncbi:metal ABC transporter solute-binding protein, Zn/Mn family [Bacillus massilinigeriensis]|uniref:metal ABC transporter solute-binding protein, Zn/Mn family n=1 Tax=Bacillus mediterraneensis TaxID=1805474 RepID=UPI000A3EFA94|nr:zinc ABC transporter substrate-binding protein [Bacillus mediterraneensis]